MDMHDIAKITAETISEIFSYKMGFLCFDENGMPEKSFVQQISKEKQIYREIDDVLQVK